MTANAYQRRKARSIVALLLSAQAQSTLTRHQLARSIAIMSADEWRAVAFTAGVAVADLECKAAVLAMLRESAPHPVRRSA
jgi:hypothetical protein